MKKYKLIVMFTLIAFLVSFKVFADVSILTKSQAIDKAINNSVQILTQNNSIKKLEWDSIDSILQSRSMGDLLAMNERMEELKSLQIRTPQESMELSALSGVLNNGFSEEEKYDIAVNSELTEDNMKYVIDLNKSTLQDLKNRLVVNVEELYSNLNKIESAIRVKRLLIDNIVSNYSKSNAKYKLGKVSKNDLNLLNIKLQKEKLELNKLNYQRLININNIQKIIGESQSKSYGEYQNEVIQDVSIDTFDRYINDAFGNRNDIVAAKQLYEMKEKEYNIAKRYYPFENDIEHQEALINMEQAKYDFDILVIDVQTEVDNVYKEAEKKLNELKSADYLLQVKENNYKEATSKYKLGLVTDLQLATANIEYIDSQIKYINSKQDAGLAKLKLEYACGYKLY